ncbi:MAG: sulfatase/phosphatase domain-containing protein [Candidatus Neomarinimicrobiota bacterium]
MPGRGAHHGCAGKPGAGGDTVIFFTSDNGGQTRHTSNAPLRSGKSSLYEGGIRVPLIVRWPAKIKADSNCQVPVSSPDFYPTMLELAGGSVRGRADLDGLSLAGILTGSRSLSHDALYWHYPHYHPSGPTSPSGAVRVGDYKLIEYFEDGRLELFNLAEDLGETRDLAAERPDTAAQLRDRLHQWRQSIDARMPAPNPNYDPARDQWLDRTRGEKSIR